MSVTSRDVPWSNGSPPFRLMANVPNPARPQDRWSDAPGFQGARMVDAGTTKEGRVLQGMQFLLDPEKHIERTSAYEGSTDRRDPYTGESQSTHDTWIDKKQEAALPAGSTKDGVPVHGAGILEGLRAGESIRDPARLIIQPSRFPRAGGQPVQHEGHHRIAGAALRQKELRESGAPDWGVPVPFEIHSSVGESNAAEDAMKQGLKDRPTMSNPIVKGAYGGPKY